MIKLEGPGAHIIGGGGKPELKPKVRTWLAIMERAMRRMGIRSVEIRLTDG